MSSAKYVDSSLVVEALPCEGEDASPILVYHPIIAGGQMVKSSGFEPEACRFKSYPASQNSIIRV